jgi:predicted DNA-binding WGR domain protein
MKKIIKQCKLENTTEGHFKFWNGTLYDDNTVITEWGKIDCSNPSSKEFPNAGIEFLEKKMTEKLKKGYKKSMKTIKIYGASDDLIEIDGDMKEEFERSL